MSPPQVVDCRGRPCPIPVIELARALPSVAVGDLVEVWSDDPAARHDIPAWCAMRGQEYAGSRELPSEESAARPDGWAFVVRRLA